MNDHDDLLAWAEAEERRLLKQLKAVRAVIDAYASDDGGATRRRRARRSLSTRAGTMMHQVEAVAVEYLQQHGRRAQSAELLQVMHEHGLFPAGRRPTASLAAMLSLNPLFDNVRNEGYGLVEWSAATKSESDIQEAAE